MANFCLFSVLTTCLGREKGVQKPKKCANVIYEWYFVDGECKVLRESPIETGLTGDLKSVCRFVGHCAILNGLGFSYKLQKISFLVLLCRSHEPNPQQGRRKVQKIGGKICR